jgi:filamentous hemagglutinin family protein
MRRHLAAAVAVLAVPTAAGAQVVLDGTFGPAGPRVGPNFVVPASVGKLSGTNLFHSFSQLNVNQGESVTFTAPSDVPVSNVLARVTGGQPSNINGLLRSAIPGANFYLVNPAGVVFGPEAQLDVSGSFAVTTADRIRLADGSTFEASASAAAAAAADAVLTSAAPAAFGFLAAKPASITYDGGGSAGGLTVGNGAVLSVVGGDVRITAGTLRSVSGRVNVVSVASPGEVALDPTSLDAPLTLTGFSAQGAIEMSQQSLIAVQEGGRAFLRGGSLTLNRSGISALAQDVPGGLIDLGFTGDVTLLNGRINSETVGPAAGASVTIKAGGAVSIDGLADDASGPITTTTSDAGAGGGVTIDAKSLTMTRDASIDTFTSSGAPSGGIDVKASDFVRIDGTGSFVITGLAAETLVGSDGPAGSINVDAPLVEIRNQGEITNTTRGNGPAGTITVRATNFVVDGGGPPTDGGEPKLTGLQSRVADLEGIGATGAGGTIDVTVDDTLTLTNGGVLSASTFGRGDGGDLNVTADKAVFSSNSPAIFTGLFARSTLPERGGTGGRVTLKTNALDVTGPAQISAVSTGDGRAGDVTVNVAGSVHLAQGAAVTARAGFDELKQDVALAMADAGSITLTSGRDVLLDSGGVISARATRDSGTVKVTAPHHVRLKDSSITAQAGRTGGMIDIDPEAVVLDHSVINGLAGGKDVFVRIRSDVLLTSESQILTDTAVLPPEVDIAGSLVRLNAGLASDAAKLAEICGMRAGGGNVSSFVATGRGGTPLQPGGFEPVLEIRDGK